MDIQLLGSGGYLRIPRACCSCRICSEARKKGVPYERLGQSLFIHGENILFDTPEDINTELNRFNIKKVSHLFYSHWHPDHSAGVRVLETMNDDKKSCTNVYLNDVLKSDFEKRVNNLFFFEKSGWCKINLGDKFKINRLDVDLVPLNNGFAHAFLIKEHDKKLVYCPCHCMHMPIKDELKNADVFVMNLGYFKGDDSDKTAFERDNLRLIDELKPKLTVFTHIEETLNKNYDDYCKLEKKYKEYNVKFGFDGMKFKI